MSYLGQKQLQGQVLSLVRVCMLTKFPPIQGGISSRSYWLARGLAEAGLKVDVVTNANCVEPEYRIPGCEDHLEEMPNVRVHNLREDVPWHIPFSYVYGIRLLNVTLELIRGGQVDIVDSGFLVPYGLIAYISNRITGVPYVVRHGGSDLAKFFSHDEFRRLIELTLSDANAIITDKEHAVLFGPLNPRVHIVAQYVPDERCFNPEKVRDQERRMITSTERRPLIAYIGKINYHWNNKRLVEMLSALDEAFSEYSLLFIAQGKGLEDFKRSIPPAIASKAVFRPFVPPWIMPRLISSVDYVVLPYDEKICSPSNLEKEVIACGQDLIISRKGRLEFRPASSCTSPVRSNDNAYLNWIRQNVSILNSCLTV